ncbi:MAG: methyltransferase domain-containing protein [Cytophagales bacterium]|nr:methyltransferase domain-containing protein [Cytophagales bacterium]MDW8383645.1 methyltransferase domain-containing protein [Flammeovirgaceae bacterium]
MKKLFHRNLILAIAQTLEKVFKYNQYADRALEELFAKNKQWGSRDRAFIAENFYDMVRWWRLICFCADTDYSNPNQNYFQLVGVWFLLQNKELPSWDEWKTLCPSLIAQKKQQAQNILAVRFSMPDWLFERGLSELQQRWLVELESLNQIAPLVIRANLLKTSLEQLFDYFKSQNIDYQLIQGCPEAILILRRQNLFRLEGFQKGWFEIQDASSQRVAHLLSPQSGMRIVDACAGGGGKTLHIAALMKNKGSIIALDVEEHKLQNLKKRAKRAGVSIIETRLIRSFKIIKRLYNTADRLLLDVPCSGTGVLRRNPDAKWKLQPSFLENLQKTQQEILQKYSPIVKSGGKMVYATCSILPSENEKQIQTFLHTQQGKFFTLQEEISISPAQSGFDGFYMALLAKN